MLDRTITVLSNNLETLDGVQQYLQRAGARARSASRLEDAATCAADADAVVLFADDYPRASSLRAFAQLRAERPSALLVVVTEDVDAFTSLARAERGVGGVVVLRRPAWGWMLVDAIRGGATGAERG
jgi:DNA-binding NarL/FixJ family response regulator